MDDRKEDGVATLLRRRREELERDIDTVARQLRIRAIYIRAIEEGRLQDLPGTAYAVGFVRAYADYLGLDGNSIVSDYRDELARRSRQNQLIWPVDQVEHKHFPGGIILVVSLVLAVALYGGWYFVSQPGGTGSDLIDRVPDCRTREAAEETTEPVEGAAVAPSSTTTAEAAAPAPAAQPTPTQPVTAVPAAPATIQTPTEQAATTPALTEPATILPATQAPADSAAVTGATSTLPPAAPTDPATMGTTPAGTAATDPSTTAVPPAGNASTPVDSSVTPAEGVAPEAAAPAATDSSQLATTTPLAGPAVDPTTAVAADAAPPANRIMLRAAKDSWVEIFDADNQVVLQRILRAGETYAVPDQPGLVMNTGNAGGLVIEVDGREQPSLGSIGVVKRDIRLEPGALTGQ